MTYPTVSDAREVARACLEIIDRSPALPVSGVKAAVDEVWAPGMTAEELVGAVERLCEKRKE